MYSKNTSLKKVGKFAAMSLRFARRFQSALGRSHSALCLMKNGQSRMLCSLQSILASVKKGSLSPKDALSLIESNSIQTQQAPEDTLQYFANLDHTRSFRTGFPEVVFAETKTPQQVAMILDDMARHVNESIESGTDFNNLPGSTAILATRYDRQG